MTDTYTVTTEELRQFIVQAFQRWLLQNGYSVKTMKRVIALRKLKADELAEQEAIEDVYRSAMGM